MDGTAFEQDLLHFICRLCGCAEAITRDTALLESGLIDSRRIVDLIEFVEQRLGISVPDDKLSMEHFRTAADIVRSFLPAAQVQPVSCNDRRVVR